MSKAINFKCNVDVLSNLERTGHWGGAICKECLDPVNRCLHLYLLFILWTDLCVFLSDSNLNLQNNDVFVKLGLRNEIRASTIKDIRLAKPTDWSNVLKNKIPGCSGHQMCVHVAHLLLFQEQIYWAAHFTQITDSSCWNQGSKSLYGSHPELLMKDQHRSHLLWSY